MRLFNFKKRIGACRVFRGGSGCSIKFNGGDGYWATNGVNGNQVIVVASERKGGVVTFVKPCALFNVRVGEFDGRETAEIVLEDGVYHLSAATVAPLQEASKVVRAILGK